MAEHSVGRPVRELDLADDFGAHPERVGGIRGGDAVEGGIVHAKRGEPCEEVAQDPNR